MGEDSVRELNRVKGDGRTYEVSSMDLTALTAWIRTNIVMDPTTAIETTMTNTSSTSGGGFGRETTKKGRE